MLLGTFEFLRSSAALYREFIMDKSDYAIFVMIVMLAISLLPIAQNLWRVSFLCSGSSSQHRNPDLRLLDLNGTRLGCKRQITQ